MVTRQIAGSVSGRHRAPAAAGSRRRHLLRRGARLGVAAMATGAVGGLAALGVIVPAGAAPPPAGHSRPGYTFFTLGNRRDLTFNQLLGINNNGVIAGYFGSGAAGHPNKGYVLRPPYGQRDYRNENFPGSVQTQVTGLNDLGVTVGFWANSNNASQVNANFGFYAFHRRHFHSVNFPADDNATPPVNQLLGVNDHGIAAGFYTDAQGNNHGYLYSLRRHRFRVVTVRGATSVTAAAINNTGGVAGFFTSSSGATDGFLLLHGKRLITLSFPGASSTMALGVSDEDEVVGVYVPASNPNALDGFTWTPRCGFTTVNDPDGVGTTTINGVNDHGDLVGFYVDSAGNTDGMLALPRH